MTITYLSVDDLITGDILLCCSSDGKVHEKFREVIRTVTGSKYTHAAIYLGDKLIAESVIPKGVQKDKIENIISSSDHIAIYQATRCLDKRPQEK